MQITLIHQPGAGDASQPAAAELRQLIRAAGHEATYVSAQEDWRAALEDHAELVVVAGGDGTVGRVAQALVGRDVPFTALPLGTANNIARTLGLADRPVAELIAAWAHGIVTRHDVGLARGPWGARHFIEGCGAGVFACLLPEADNHPTLEALAHADAKLDYALQLLRERLATCAVQPLELALDGEDLSGDYLMLEAMNMQYVGPRLYLAPACDLADGLLDVVLVRAEERVQLHRHLADWQNGHEWPAALGMRRGSRLELRWTGFPFHLDDTLWPEQDYPRPASGTIELTVRPGALRFLADAQVRSDVA